MDLNLQVKRLKEENSFGNSKRKGKKMKEEKTLLNLLAEKKLYDRIYRYSTYIMSLVKKSLLCSGSNY